MNGGELHRLARFLREVALTATADAEERVSASLLAIVEDIAGHDGTSVGEIAERTALAQSLVSKTVAMLRDAGALRTTRDPADRRRRLISIEPAMWANLKSRGSRPIQSALRAKSPDAPAKDLRRAEKLLDELAGLLL